MLCVRLATGGCKQTCSSQESAIVGMMYSDEAHMDQCSEGSSTVLIVSSGISPSTVTTLMKINYLKCLGCSSVNANKPTEPTDWHGVSVCFLLTTTGTVTSCWSGNDLMFTDQFSYATNQLMPNCCAASACSRSLYLHASNN